MTCDHCFGRGHSPILRQPENDYSEHSMPDDPYYCACERGRSLRAFAEANMPPPERVADLGRRRQRRRRRGRLPTRGGHHARHGAFAGPHREHLHQCVACFARVEPEPAPAVEPDGTVEQAYADDTCAARPVAIVRGKPPADIVTSEPGWHYDGSDPKVHHYTRAVALERACWRVEGGTGCECRGLMSDESAYAE